LLERAADPLNRSRINAKPRGDLTHALGSSWLVQGRSDRLFHIGRYRRPTKALALAPGPRKPGADALLNHCALEFGEHAHHLKHGLACRRRGVDPLLMQEQIDVERMQLGQEGNEVVSRL
jgi:hypothetical protein